MITDLVLSKLDSVMTLWLETNIDAHDFISPTFWKSNYDMVKEMIPQGATYIYEKENKVIAFIGMTEGYIGGLFVESKYQCKGVGKELLNHVKVRYQTLQLSVYEKNTKAVTFYLRQGFVITTKVVDENTGELEYHMTWNK